MAFTQLASPIPVVVLEKGKGMAFAVIDYGAEHNLIWVTALDDSGEIWCAPNPLVRVQPNWTLGRRADPAMTGAGEGNRRLPATAAPVQAPLTAVPLDN